MEESSESISVIDVDSFWASILENSIYKETISSRTREIDMAEVGDHSGGANNTTPIGSGMNNSISASRDSSSNSNEVETSNNQDISETILTSSDVCHFAELMANDIMTPGRSHNDLISSLSMLSNVLEKADMDFMKADSGRTPFNRSVAAREEHHVGLMTRTLHEYPGFTEFLAETVSDINVNDDTSGFLRSSFARIILAMSGLEHLNFIFTVLDANDRFDMINRWVQGELQPLRCFATGILALGLLDRPIADIQVKEITTEILLRRLRHMVQNDRFLDVRRFPESVSSKLSPSIRNALMPFFSDERVKAREGSMEITNDNNANSQESSVHAKDSRFKHRELVFVLNYLANVGEYQEVLAPALGENILEVVMILLHSSTSKIVLLYALMLTSHLLAHKKFAMEFVDAGGVHVLLELATSNEDRSYCQGGVAMCLYGLGSLAGVMETVLRLPEPIPSRMLSLALELLSSPVDGVRKHAVIFFGLCLPFPVVLQAFDASNGVGKLIMLIKDGTKMPSIQKRQIAHHAILCVRTYFRTHLAILVHEKMRLRKQNVNASYSVGRRQQQRFSFPRTKTIEIDEKVTHANMAMLDHCREELQVGGEDNYLRHPSIANWEPINEFLTHEGFAALLSVVDQMRHHVGDSNTSGVLEMATYALETLHIVAVTKPASCIAICKAVVDSASGRIGITSLLECCTAHTASNELVKAALKLFSTCVSPHHKPTCRFSPYRDVRHFSLRTENNYSCKLPLRRTRGCAADNKVTPSICDCAGNDKFQQQIVRQLAREKNAIRVFLQIFRSKRFRTVSTVLGDEIRLLACRSLLGLARDKKISQLLGSMQLGSTILMPGIGGSGNGITSNISGSGGSISGNSGCTGNSSYGVGSFSNGSTGIGTDEKDDFNQVDSVATQVQEHAMALVSLVSSNNTGGIILNSDVADSSARKIEKAGIVARTKISYDQNNLLQIIHSHLVKAGCPQAAAALSAEAKLNQGLSPSHRPAKVPRLNMESEETLLDDNFEFQRPSKMQKRDCMAIKTSSSRPTTLKLKRISRRPKSNIYFRDLPKKLNAPSFFDDASANAASPVVYRQAKTSKKPRDPMASFVSLDTIVTHYLRDMHRQCANPVEVIPPFDLTTTRHQCGGKSGALSNTIAFSPSQNIARRMLYRQVQYSNEEAKALGSTLTRKLIHSRFRPWRSIRYHDLNMTVASFLYGSASSPELILGSDIGEVRIAHAFDIDAAPESWECHTGPISSIGTTTRHPNLFLTSTCSAPVPETAVWNRRSMESGAQIELSNARDGVFSHSGDVLLTRVLNHNNEGAGHVVNIHDLTTGVSNVSLSENRENSNEHKYTNAQFSPSDAQVLFDGSLFDIKSGSRIHKFDKLSNSGMGYFHPGGNEILINCAIWDVRMCKLVRLVPSLDHCTMKFNASGSVLYAFRQYMDEFDQYRKRSKFSTMFKVLDTAHGDYRDVATIDLERPIFDVNSDLEDNFLAVVEGHAAVGTPVAAMESYCRLYEIGRKRPSDADSDVDDGGDDSDQDDDDWDDETNSNLELEDNNSNIMINGSEDEELLVMDENGSLVPSDYYYDSVDDDAMDEDSSDDDDDDVDGGNSVMNISEDEENLFDTLDDEDFEEDEEGNLEFQPRRHIVRQIAANLYNSDEEHEEASEVE